MITIEITILVFTMMSSLYTTGKGQTEEIVRKISEVKNEPQWMLDYCLRSLELFHKIPFPDWGSDLSGINFDDVIYY